MYCPNCGKAVEEGARFCEDCGQALQESAVTGQPQATAVEAAGSVASGAAPGTEEQVLFSFGPFGVDICNGPYSIFRTWHRRNSAIIELTNTRLCALPNRSFGLLTVPAMKYPWGAKLPFEIPYSSIVSLQVQRHPSPIALMDVLYMKYREGGVEQEKCVASYKNNISRAYQVINAACQGLTAP